MSSSASGSARFRRLEDFAERVAEDLGRLGDRVNEADLQTDEFAFIFERAFRGATENYQREKLEAFRGILVNAAIPAGVNTMDRAGSSAKRTWPMLTASWS